MQVKSNVKLLGPFPRWIFHRIVGNHRSLIGIGVVALLTALEIRASIKIHCIHIHIVRGPASSGFIAADQTVGCPDFHM